MQSEVEVTQADRDAAWPFRESGYRNDRSTKAKWDAGVYDRSARSIQAFARHRLASRGRRQVIKLIERLEALPPDELEYVRLLPETQRLLAILSLPSAPGEKG